MIALKPCRALDPCLSNPGVWIPCCDGRIVVCPWCYGYRAFGESDERGERTKIEIALAALLAEYGCEYEGEALDEIHEVLVPIFADDTPPPPNPNLRKPGPRSPVEMMVDRACGIDDGATR